MLNLDGKFSKIADVCISETPTPLESATVGNLDPPPPLKIADVLCGRPQRGIRMPSPKDRNPPGFLKRNFPEPQSNYKNQIEETLKKFRF